MTDLNDNRKIELPVDFMDRMKTLLGESEWEDFYKGYTHDTYKALRLNPWKMKYAFTGKENLPFSLYSVPWEENGFYYGPDDRPGKHPYHDGGLYYMQEPSAMSAASLAGAKPGEKVLDLCAAPGGKTTQLAAGMDGQGLLISNEIHPARARILSSNVERMGIPNAIVTNETPDRLSARFPGFFDLVVVDAPCSGEGMFLKEPEAIPQWSLSNVDMCGVRQREILAEAVKMVRPGGRMVYSTCTFAPVENEGSIAWLLHNYPDFHVMAADGFSMFSAGRPEWIPEEFLEGASGEEKESIRAQIRNTFRLWPHKLKGEGHFAALLVRDGESEISSKKKSGSLNASVVLDKKMRKDLEKFLADIFCKEGGVPARMADTGHYVRFGDHIYLCPSEIDLAGLKVVRPGLHIADICKNRIEPAHALAMSLRPFEAGRVLNLHESDGNSEKYIHGETLDVEEAVNGWTLVTVDGVSLGWGKVSGGILKNHYPKGLRRN